MSDKISGGPPWQAAMAGLVSVLWIAVATGISSRVHLVMDYLTIPAGPSYLEPFMASHAAWAFAALAMLGWWGLFWRASVANRRTALSGVLFLAVSLVPGLIGILRGSYATDPAAPIYAKPLYWEPLWLAFWTGISVSKLVTCAQARVERPRWLLATLVLLASGCAGWWYWQTVSYYENFMLGYNDFGHFAQRVVNTAEGRGWLLESPVLPAYWDHFNPGLGLLVPLWKIFPTVHLFFALQAVCLAASALLIYAISRKCDHSEIASSLWALAWLAQPILGQMNLAYTYGWHPITLAIPGMLGTLLLLQQKRFGLALALAVLTMSMEEGVIVVVCLFSGACFVLGLLPRQTQMKWLKVPQPVFGVSSWVWGIAAASTAVVFVAVYRFSGFAEFQTGRFVALGDSAFEVVLSPILRPGEFWGQLFRWQKLAFVASLWIPCYAVGLWRGRGWLLATLLPMLVLLVWDHQPASSLGFQYTSTLLPLFWFAAIQGARVINAVGTSSDGIGASAGALATGLVLSLYVGQMPYSSPTLLDVEGRTYAISMESRRTANSPDGVWLRAQVEAIRKDAGEVLATGRIAAHLVGNRDVETVGQYLERREELSQLPDRRGNPIGHYQWIILDRKEKFQQTISSSKTVEAEALQSGFRIQAEAHDIVVLRKADEEV